MVLGCLYGFLRCAGRTHFLHQKCKECGYLYIGETGRKACKRGMEHRKEVRKKDEENVFHQHNVESHNGSLTPSDFAMTVTGVYRGDATKRQVAEAIQMQRAQGPGLVNKRDERRQVNLPRVEFGHN